MCLIRLTHNQQITVFYWVKCALFYTENDAEILPVHYARKVAEKGLQMALWWKNLQWLFLLKLFLKNKNNFFLPKIIVKFSQVHTILVCTSYSIKYGSLTNIFKVKYSGLICFNVSVSEKKYKYKVDHRLDDVHAATIVQTSSADDCIIQVNTSRPPTGDCTIKHFTAVFYRIL